MEEHRGNAAKEVPRRIRGKAEEGKRPTGGPTGVASSSRGPADAGPSAVSGTAPVVDVISKVTSTFGHEEVEPGVSMEETLADPKLRASAAKWRSGSDGRRATALLARLLNGIHSIKPSWLDGSPAVEPQPVRTLPVREAIHGPPAPQARWKTLWHWVWSRYGFWTLGLGLLIVVFPKIFALVVTAIMRLLVRAILALLGRMVAELGRELKEMVMQVSLATSSTEEVVLQYMDELMAMGSSPSPSPVVPTSPSSSTASSLSASSQSLPPCSPNPNPPWSFLSCLLLVLDLFLRLRPMGGAGV